jgi:16S rRNA processing protein RimM
VARAKSRASRKLPPSKAELAPHGAGREAGGRFDGDESQLVVMGRIVGPFGVQGWLKVKAFTEEPNGLGGFQMWLVGGHGAWREMRLEDFEVHSKGPVAKLAGCDDREGADKLRGCDIAVARAELGEPDEGTMYWVDLVGLEVVDEGGAILGKVEALFETGATSVMVVRESAVSAERMIPFVAQYVKSVDREAKRITVDWKADYDA